MNLSIHALLLLVAAVSTDLVRSNDLSTSLSRLVENAVEVDAVVAVLYGDLPQASANAETVKQLDRYSGDWKTIIGQGGGDRCIQSSTPISWLVSGTNNDLLGQREGDDRPSSWGTCFTGERAELKMEWAQSGRSSFVISDRDNFVQPHGFFLPMFLNHPLDYPRYEEWEFVDFGDNHFEIQNTFGETVVSVEGAIVDGRCRIASLEVTTPKVKVKTEALEFHTDEFDSIPRVIRQTIRTIDGNALRQVVVVETSSPRKVERQRFLEVPEGVVIVSDRRLNVTKQVEDGPRRVTDEEMILLLTE
ncbi:MAG: hypothetical protein AAGD32_08120 [Planctomycetota bacterium]